MENSADNGLAFRKITGGSETYAQVCALYQEAFPAEEQLSLSLLRFFALKRGVEFMSYHDSEENGCLCGITYTVELDQSVYLLYLAVCSGARGKGYGTRILSCLKDRFPEKQIVLEIEPLDSAADNFDQRKRRLAFYERNGFSQVGYDLYEGTVRYTMLATGERFEADAFAASLRRATYGLYRFTIRPS